VVEASSPKKILVIVDPFTEQEQQVLGPAAWLRAENLHVHEGLAYQCLQQVATSQQADFLVMGAIARRGIKRVLIGSTAARVLDRLPCDLVSIKPATFVAPGS
jgi:universal stress protein E